MSACWKVTQSTDDVNVQLNKLKSEVGLYETRVVEKEQKPIDRNFIIVKKKDFLFNI